MVMWFWQIMVVWFGQFEVGLWPVYWCFYGATYVGSGTNMTGPQIVKKLQIQRRLQFFLGKEIEPSICETSPINSTHQQ